VPRESAKLGVCFMTVPPVVLAGNYSPYFWTLICVIQVVLQQENDEAARARADLPASCFVKGLVNPHNSCFFNSIVQFLASSAFLCSSRSISELEELNKVGPSLASVLTGVNEFDSDDRPYNALHLLQHIARKNPIMNGQSQQDSHEALMLLLDLVDSESKKADAHRTAPPDPGSCICELCFIVSTHEP
jgi:ubiquitin C-terminal hydrolase